MSSKDLKLTTKKSISMSLNIIIDFKSSKKIKKLLGLSMIAQKNQLHHLNFLMQLLMSINSLIWHLFNLNVFILGTEQTHAGNIAIIMLLSIPQQNNVFVITMKLIGAVKEKWLMLKTKEHVAHAGLFQRQARSKARMQSMATERI